MKKAQSLIEYTLILVLISLIAVATLHFMGKHMSFNKDSQNLDSNKNIVETMKKTRTRRLIFILSIGIYNWWKMKILC